MVDHGKHWSEQHISYLEMQWFAVTWWWAADISKNNWEYWSLEATIGCRGQGTMKAGQGERPYQVLDNGLGAVFL